MWTLWLFAKVVPAVFWPSLDHLVLCGSYRSKRSRLFVDLVVLSAVYLGLFVPNFRGDRRASNIWFCCSNFKYWFGKIHRYKPTISHWLVIYPQTHARYAIASFSGKYWLCKLRAQNTSHFSNANLKMYCFMTKTHCRGSRGAFMSNAILSSLLFLHYSRNAFPMQITFFKC